MNALAETLLFVMDDKDKILKQHSPSDGKFAAANGSPVEIHGNSAMANGGAVDILVVEDNEPQRTSIVAALKAAIPDVSIVSVRNGSEALDFLFARGPWPGREGEAPPRLILLDLAMPGTNNSFSVLGQIRSIEPREALTVAPVVIFTDSQAPADVKESYRCGANSYILKPISFPDFKKVVETVGKYWMKHNKTV